MNAQHFGSSLRYVLVAILSIACSEVGQAQIGLKLLEFEARFGVTTESVEDKTNERIASSGDAAKNAEGRRILTGMMNSYRRMGMVEIRFCSIDTRIGGNTPPWMVRLGLDDARRIRMVTWDNYAGTLKDETVTALLTFSSQGSQWKKSQPAYGKETWRREDGGAVGIIDGPYKGELIVSDADTWEKGQRPSPNDQ